MLSRALFARQRALSAGCCVLHIKQMATLLVDLLGFLFHRGGGSPLQIFTALPECQVLTLDGSQQKNSPGNASEGSNVRKSSTYR